MEYDINVSIEPYHAEKLKKVGIKYYYLCPIKDTEDICFIFKMEEENIMSFIERVKDAITNGSISYDIKQNIKKAMLTKGMKVKSQSDFELIQQAFKDMEQINVKIDI